MVAKMVQQARQTDPWCQGLVRGLDGRSHLITVPAAAGGVGARVGDVAAAVAALPAHCGLDLGYLRLGTLARELDLGCPGALLPRDPASGLIPTVAILVRVRGGKGGFGSLLRGSKSKTKSENNDACRDLSGRRLRHVNNEKKMQTWVSETKERELEKKAIEWAKKQELLDKGDRAKEEEARKLAGESHQLTKKVASSVQNGLAEAAKLQEETQKRKAAAAALAGPSSSKRPHMGLLADDDLSDSDDSDDDAPAPKAKGKAKAATPPTPPAEAAAPAPAAPAAPASAPASAPAASVDKGPVDLSNISSAKQLEALGPDRLKVELMRHGLKCGGSLQERAARLYLLTSTALKDLDRKHFAKPPPEKK